LRQQSESLRQVAARKPATSGLRLRDACPTADAALADFPPAEKALKSKSHVFGEDSMPGLWFEDFEVGKVYRHPITRTVTEMDNMMFSCLTMNPQPLHIDRHFAAETEWGQPLMNSLFTLGLMIGISVNDLTVGTTIANLGMTEVKFPAPLFQGDTVSVTTEVKGKRESRSRPDAGIVDFEHRAYKQDGTLVAQCQRQAFMRKRPQGA
jgi:acyl dehydratase